MAAPARKLHTQQIHQISRTINYNDTGNTTGLAIGTLPLGAVLDKTMVQTSTAWNGTVSVTLSVGTTLTGTDLINATDVRTAAARVDTVVPIAKAGPYAADQIIYASVTLGGTAGSAGVTTVIVTYVAAVG